MNPGIRALILFLIVVGMPVASYFLVFRPQNTSINSAIKEIEHKEQLLIKLREETARNADLVKANEQMGKSVKVIEARLPSTKELDSVVRQVSDLAVQAGLEAPAMKSSKPLPAALYMEQPLEMEIKGPFIGFFAFMANLEKLPRIMRVHDLKIVGTGTENNQVKAEFTLSIYFQDGGQVASAEGK